MGLDWQDKASCQSVSDPEIFFQPWTEKDALQYCAICPVIDQCLEYAESLDDYGLRLGAYGIWGGLTDKERGKMRRDRRRVAL
jgi:WhiB family redox-sensing transcriptional regulator